MDNYKGIYYNTKNECKSFEGGAHFRYKDLIQALKALVISLPPERTQPKSQRSIHEGHIIYHYPSEQIPVPLIERDNKPFETSDLLSDTESKSRNKPLLNNKLIFKSKLNPLSLQNTYDIHTKPKQHRHIHIRQFSDNNNNHTSNKKSLFLLSNDIKDTVTINTYKIKSPIPKLTINTYSDKVYITNNTNNNLHKKKPKKMDLIQPIKHFNIKNKKHKISNNKEHSSNATNILLKNNNLMNVMIHKYFPNYNIGQTYNQRNRTLNLSDNDKSKHNSTTRNNKKKIIMSPLRNTLSNVTINETINVAKPSRNICHQQCKSLNGLFSFRKKSCRLINLKRCATKYNNKIEVDKEEMKVKKKINFVSNN